MTEAKSTITIKLGIALVAAAAFAMWTGERYGTVVVTLCVAFFAGMEAILLALVPAAWRSWRKRSADAAHA